MSKIRVLDETTINQIAAGEVIENPASVVKELVENALDAGATDITIEIKGGGRQLIRISDNGCGMNADDALLCLERHATSKIKHVNDIYDINSMGFRGEAIPSIASISKFTLMTCPNQEQNGTMVLVEGGKVLQCTPVVHSKGSTIEVKSLFFNVPVRKKFQRSPAFDENEILKLLTSIGLANPKIKFQLLSDQKKILSAPFLDENLSREELLKKRIKNFLGMDFLDSSQYICKKIDDYLLDGFIGMPHSSRHNRSGQYTFINSRPIHCPLVSYAMRDGYGTTLAMNRHPIFVLYLNVPGSTVDVNVHPQKKEVRLRQEQVVRDLIASAVKEALNQHVSHFMSEPVLFEHIQQSSTVEDRPAVQPFAEWPKYQPVNPCVTSQSHYEDVVATKPAQIELSIPKPSKLQSPKAIATIQQYILCEPVANVSQIGQYQGFALIDQKASHSRIIFEKLLRSEDSSKQSVQQLLIPFQFVATQGDCNLILEHMDLFLKQGIQIQQIGPKLFVIDAIPSFFGNVDLQSLVSCILESIQEYGNAQKVQKEREKMLAKAASQASISYLSRLNMEEAQSLIDQLMECEMPFQCPFGKPTMIHLSSEELRKRFFT